MNSRRNQSLALATRLADDRERFLQGGSPLSAFRAMNGREITIDGMRFRAWRGSGFPVLSEKIPSSSSGPSSSGSRKPSRTQQLAGAASAPMNPWRHEVP